MSKFKFLEKDIVSTDGFILIEKYVAIEIREKKAFLTYKGENFGELTKEQASKIKLSLKPKRIRNRFKNRFLMKPIIADGEIIAHYRKDCTAHDFRANVVAVLARFEAEKNQKRKEKSKC